MNTRRGDFLVGFLLLFGVAVLSLSCCLETSPQEGVQRAGRPFNRTDVPVPLKALNMNPCLRAKFRVYSVMRCMDSNGNCEAEIVVLHPVSRGSAENERWAKYTPSGNITLHVSNSAAFGALTKDHEFYIDFTPANLKEAKPEWELRLKRFVAPTHGQRNQQPPLR